MPQQRRHFLFLQGPHGSFFRLLGEELTKIGYGVTRINLCGGDQYFWPRPGAISFTARPEHWVEFFHNIMVEHQVTDVVVYGDCRPHHLAAINELRDLADQMDVRVHVFEEGYKRPHWVTLEAGGVNGHSSLPRCPKDILARAARLPEPEEPVEVGANTRVMGFNAFVYNLFTLLHKVKYRHYRTHRKDQPLPELWGWVKRLADMPFRKLRTHKQTVDLRRSRKKWYLAIMQLDGDAQIRQHSPYDGGGMPQFIDEVMRSFAENAPDGTHLIFKNHPLDNGLVDYGAQIARLSAKLGIADRVVYIDGGKLAALTRRAKGVVTVNSTAGMNALEFGVPLKVMGRATYRIEGLAAACSLDDFWRKCPKPDADLLKAYDKIVRVTTQFNGSYYTRAGVEMVLEPVIKWMVAAPLLREAEAQRKLGDLISAEAARRAGGADVVPLYQTITEASDEPASTTKKRA
ncbi:MAG: capsular biosynthesis protein [Alphaproteobacteria bacterium]